MKVRVGYGLGNLRPLSGDALGALAEALEAQRLRLAVALGADQRARARSGARADVRGRPHEPASSSGRACRCCPAGARRSSPRSGPRSTCSPAGGRCPRSGSGSRIRSSNRRSASSGATGRRSSTRRCRWSAASGPRTASITTAAGSTTSKMNVLPKPAHPLDVWLGGKAPSELRRVGTPRRRLARELHRHPKHCKAAASPSRTPPTPTGRAIDDEHFGAMVLYTHDEIPEPFRQAIRSRNPDVEVDDLVGHGWAGVHDAVRALRRGRVLEARARAAHRAAELGRRARGRRDGRAPAADLGKRPLLGRLHAPLPFGRCAVVSLDLEESAQADRRAERPDRRADQQHHDPDPDRVVVCDPERRQQAVLMVQQVRLMST